MATPSKPRKRRQGPHVVLTGQLADAVGGDRQFGCGFRRRNDFGVTVHHPAAAGEDHPLDPTFPGALEKIDETNHIDVAVEGRPVNRNPDIDLRCVVIEHRELAGGDRLSRLRRTDVRAHEPGAFRDVRLVPPREVVQNGDFPSFPQIRFRDVRPDEPRATRDQYPAAHATRLGIPNSCNLLVEEP